MIHVSRDWDQKKKTRWKYAWRRIATLTFEVVLKQRRIPNRKQTRTSWRHTIEVTLLTDAARTTRDANVRNVVLVEFSDLLILVQVCPSVAKVLEFDFDKHDSLGIFNFAIYHDVLMIFPITSFCPLLLIPRNTLGFFKLLQVPHPSQDLDVLHDTEIRWSFESILCDGIHICIHQSHMQCKWFLFWNFHTCPSSNSVFLDSTWFSLASFQLHFPVSHPQSALLSDLEFCWPLQQHCFRPRILLVIGTTYAMMTIFRSSNKLLCLCPYSYPCLRLAWSTETWQNKFFLGDTVFALVLMHSLVSFDLVPDKVRRDFH